MKPIGITVNLNSDKFRNAPIAYKTGEHVYPIPEFKFSDNIGKISIVESLTKKLRTMRNLKDLTQDECIEIAKIINPDVNWKIIIPEHTWDGFDLVDAESNTIPHNNIVQICYNSNELFREFDSELYEINISDRTVYKIILYLQSINVEI